MVQFSSGSLELWLATKLIMDRTDKVSFDLVLHPDDVISKTITYLLTKIEKF